MEMDNFLVEFGPWLLQTTVYFPLSASAIQVRSRPVLGKHHPTLAGLSCLLPSEASALIPDVR